MSNWSRNRDSFGFTLIELMISITILTIIVGIVYASFSTVVSATEDARAASARLRFQQFLTRTLVQNLRQAQEGWLPGAAFRDSGLGVEDVGQAEPEPGEMRYFFLGEDAEGPFGPADSVVFATTARLTGPKALPGFYKLVSFRVVTDELEAAGPERLLAPLTDQYTARLEVVEVPVVGHPIEFEESLVNNRIGQDGLRSAVESIGATDSIGYEPGVSSFPIWNLNLRYFDGDEWRDSWDSQTEGRLPWAVEIRVNLVPEDDEAAPEVERFDPDVQADVQLVVGVAAGAGVLDEPPGFIRPDRTVLPGTEPQRGNTTTGTLRQ